MRYSTLHRLLTFGLVVAVVYLLVRIPPGTDTDHKLQKLHVQKLYVERIVADEYAVRENTYSNPRSTISDGMWCSLVAEPVDSQSNSAHR